MSTQQRIVGGGQGTPLGEGYRARIIRTIRYAHVAQDAVGAVLNPSVVMLRKGTATAVNVVCLIAVGGQQVTPESISYLTTTYGAEIAPGLTWLSAAGENYSYKLMYNGNTDINVNVPVRLTYKGVEYPCTLSIRTYEQGSNGEDAWSATMTPAEVTFTRGKAESVTLDAYAYRGSTAVGGPNVSCESSLPAYLSFEAPDELSYNGVTGSNVVDTALTFKITPTGGPVMRSCVRVRFADPPLKPDPSPYCPPPRVWEEYPEGYEFQNGTDEGCTRTDVVMQGDDKGYYIAYRCLVTHVKATAHQPKSDNNDSALGIPNPYWFKEDTRYTLLSTKLILADGAYIDLLSTNGIRIYDSNKNIVGEIVGTTEDGNSFVVWIGNKATDGSLDPLWAVNALGTHFIGGTSGQRIEINPTNRDISVYDADGALVATHSGRYIDPATAVPTAAAQNYGIVLSAASFSATGRKNWQSTNASKQLTGNGQMKIPIPAFTLKAKRRLYDSSTMSELAPVTETTLELSIFVNGTLERKITLGSAKSSAMNSQSSASGTTPDYNTNREVTVAVPARTEIVPMKAGDTFIALLSLTTTISGGHGTDGFGSITWGATAMTCSYTADCYIAHYGANGFVIASNTDNYIYVLVGKDKKLYVKCVSGGKTVFTNT